MSAKLVWNSESSSGAFKFSVGVLHLLLNNDNLDRLVAAAPARNGLSISLQENGLYSITACGECTLLFNEASTNQIEISAKQSFSLIGDDSEIDLVIDATVVIDDPLVGTTIGGHEILERLGHGGVGIVYRALQLDLKREVALKVLSNKSTQQGAATIEAFKREAIAAGRMSHPNLVQVYSVGEDNGVYFFAMEVVAGGDAETHLKSFGEFAEMHAIDVICQVAEALQYAASNGMVHRDIKPENLLFAGDGRVKLADLGMSSTRELVGGDGIGGTPHFMPPEAIANPNAVDQRSDYYSLGCTLFRLLTGSTPYSGNSVKEILLAHRDDEIPQLIDFIDGSSKEAQELIDWLMAKEQDDRPQSAAEIIEFCKDILSPSKRSSMPFVGATAVVLLVITAVILQKPEETETTIVVEKVFDEQLSSEVERLQAELDAARLKGLHLTVKNNSGEGINTHDNTASETVAESEAKQKQKLVNELNATVSELLASLQFNQALDLITASKVDAAEKAKALQQVFAGFDAELGRGEALHAALLNTNDFSQAQAITSQLISQLDGRHQYPALLKQRLDNLDAARVAAIGVYQHAQALKQRQQFRAQHYTEVGQPLRDFDLNSASAGLAKINAELQSPQYAASSRAYQQLFAKAAQAQSSLWAKLSSGEATIKEPTEGKRAFVSKADLSGIHIMLQVRGERIPRHDSWQQYLRAEQWNALLNSVEIDVTNNVDFQALSILIATSQAADVLKNIATYDTVQVKDALHQLQQWQQLLTSIDYNSVAAQELSALLKAVSIVSNINDGRHYSALQLLDLFMQRMSLLAIWSTNGEVAFIENE
jgi:serine/threonine protein kinase